MRRRNDTIRGNGKKQKESQSGDGPDRRTNGGCGLFDGPVSIAFPPPRDCILHARSAESDCGLRGVWMMTVGETMKAAAPTIKRRSEEEEDGRRGQFIATNSTSGSTGKGHV